MVLSEIGEQAFSIALWVSIIITIGGLILASSGVTLPYPINMLTIPVSLTYNYAKQLINSPVHTVNIPIPVVGSFLGKLIEAGSFVTSIGIAVAGVLINFAMLIVSFFIILAIVIYEMLPPYLSYLVMPVFFIASFVQLCIYVYVFKKISESLTSITITGARI